VTLPVTVFIDCQPAKFLAESYVANQRTKHFDVKLHHVRNNIKDGMVALEYIPTEHQIADCLTKALAKEKIKVFVKKMNLSN
jgi:hypothetical protein